METIGVTNDTIAPQCSCRDAAAVRLTVVGVFQQNADDLYAESLFQFLVADVVTQVRVDLDDAFSHTGVALHVSVFCHPMGTESREQRLFAEEPAFGYL